MPSFPLLRAEVSRVLEPFEHAVSLPGAAYFDDTVFALERTAIFDRSWQCVGREEDAGQPGEWFTSALQGEDLIVMRGADLVLRAFYNVCRHRAATLLDGPCGRAQEIRCAYHGWTYELSGALREAPGARHDLDRAANGLSQLRLQSWQGFVFATADETLPELATYVADAPSWLRESPLALARRAHASAYDVAANWKLLVENFQESDHFTRIHPALERLTPTSAARSVLSSGPWLGGTMTFAEGVETVSETGKRNGRPFIAAPAYRHQVSDAMLFPTLLTSLQPDYLLTYRLYPKTPGLTHVVAEIFLHPAAFTPSFEASELATFWGVVNAQDRAICERQQMGVRSRGYRASRYSTVEDGVHAFDTRVARAYLA
jgi:Rieske 2Fe-2S family protein